MVITAATSSMILTSSTFSSNIALKNVVKAPHIIANALDWKIGAGIPATALTIDVYTDRIGLALATVDHDKQQSNNYTGTKYDQVTTTRTAAVTNRSYFSCKVLDSIPLVPPPTNYNKSRIRNNNKKRIAVSPEDKYRLSGLVQEHSISGFIVSWPLQKDTGLMGASCGRTLFTIEQLLDNDEEEEDDDYTKIFTPNRPICFWDGGMHKTEQQEQPQPDIFGRCSIYARTSTKREHRASKEQYFPQNEFSTMNAMKVWEDFYQTHWPITVTHNNNNNNNNDVFDNDTSMQQQQEKQIKEKEQQQEREKNHHVNYPTHNNSNNNTLNRNDDIFRFSSLVQKPNNSNNNNNDNDHDNNSNAELLTSPYISTRRRKTLAASSLVSMA